jgi:hypothetical protein
MAIQQGKTSSTDTADGFYLGRGGTNNPLLYMSSNSNSRFLYYDTNNGNLHTQKIKATELTIEKADGTVVFDTNEFDGTYIEAATIDTLQIAGNAVSVPDSGTGNLTARTLSSTRQTLAEISNYTIGNTQGIAGSLLILGGCSISGNDSNNTLVKVSLFVDGNSSPIIEHGITIVGTGSFYATLSAEFSVPSGYTKTLQLRISSPSGKAISQAQGYIVAMGAKR